MKAIIIALITIATVLLSIGVLQKSVEYMPDLTMEQCN